MADQRERIEAELEQIEQAIGSLPAVERLPELSRLELAGVGAILHNAYTGVENVLKQLVRDAGREIPAGPSWHRDLLVAAAESGVITEQLMESLLPLLAFRHFFMHGYSLDLDAGRCGRWWSGQYNCRLCFGRRGSIEAVGIRWIPSRGAVDIV